MAGEHQVKERGEPEPAELFWLCRLLFCFLTAALFMMRRQLPPRHTGVSVARGTVFIKPAADILMLPTR